MSVCPYCRRELVSLAADGLCPFCRAPLSLEALDPAAWAAAGQAYEDEPAEDAPAVIRASLAAYAARLRQQREPETARALDGSPLADVAGAAASPPMGTVYLPAGGIPLADLPPAGPQFPAPPSTGDRPPPSLTQTFALDERDTDATGIFPSLVQVPPQGPSEIAKTQDFADQITNSLTAMWHEKFDPAVTPRQTLKAPDAGGGASSSRLVIKTRAFEADAAEPSVGPDYELLNVIGEGGMGVVYEARQTSIDRTVAIKMLKGNIAADASHRDKFLSEAVVTGDLDHPNIVSVYDLGSNEAGALFYSMKRVQGTPWEKVLPAKSLPENIEILMKVADAIAFAHSRGLVHRDIKPENVMLGDFGEVLVMDWGLALPTRDFRKLGLLSASSAMGGTPAYMAPEMATGPIDLIGPASDIYLLGAALYEVLTGKAPHTGRTVMECLLAAAQNKIQPTNQTGELLSIALRAMAKAPAGRYSTVRDFQAAIREYQSHSESIVLSSRAEQDLVEAEAQDDYQIFSRVIFAFEEAVALWSGNERARAGLVHARLAYGRRATAKGDLDLAASMVAEGDDADYVALRLEIKRAQQERDARQQRLRNAKRMALALALLVIVGGTFSFFRIRSERDRSRDAELQARDAEQMALRAEQEAIKSEQQALKAQTEEKASAKKALLAADRAEKAKVQALKAEGQARLESERARLAKDAE
ncbi:MAG TPA: protein kinase, partial [Pirellulales bacterium]